MATCSISYEDKIPLMEEKTISKDKTIFSISKILELPQVRNDSEDKSKLLKVHFVKLYDDKAKHINETEQEIGKSQIYYRTAQICISA